jgi:uncharacterized lipoprotein YddW (UPF0748 family)
MVMRYDIDGLHFDDYFYPYPIRGELIADGNSYFTFGRKFGDKAAWRRNNIDRFIRDTYLMLQQVKPYIKLGVSPFPIWRNDYEDPNGSETKGGLTNYSHLYADVRNWLEQGWIDYVVPQCYQSIEHSKIPFKKITLWWTKNTFGKHLYIGHAPYRLNNESVGWDDNTQILRQLAYTKKIDNIQGNAYYNATSLLVNQEGVTDQLKKVYKQIALPPTMPWKGFKAPEDVALFSVSASPKGLVVNWQVNQGSRPDRFILARQKSGTNELDYLILPGTLRNFIDPELNSTGEYEYFIAASDRLWNLSGWVKAKRDYEIQGY